jgi:SAM-dependent methyltransferase
MQAATATRRTGAGTEWFASWFDSPHYHALYAHRDDAEAAGLIDKLIERLAPADGTTALDLGCGAGRHSRHLASLGLDVTGVDLSAASIELATRTANLHLRFRRQDMRQPFGSRVFDFVFNLFTSFGYFDDLGEHLTVVHNIARSLKPGGTLVLDYLNVRYAEKHLTPQSVTERDGIRYRQSRWTDAFHFFKRILIEDPRAASQLEYQERVAKLTLEDFRFMFALCGLTIGDTFGDYRLGSFDLLRSPRLILVARKREENRDQLLPREALANAAQRLGRDAEVRREHGLRDTLDDRRVHAQELEVPLLGGCAQRSHDPLVLCGRMALQARAERRGISGDLLDDSLVRRAVDEQQVGVLDGVDEERRRRPVTQARRISEPPRLRRKLDDVLLPLRVDHVVPETAVCDKCGVPGDIARLLKKVSGRQMSLHERRAEDLEILRAERRARVEVGAQDVEGRGLTRP